MRFFSARLNLDKGILLNFKFFWVNLFQYKTALTWATQLRRLKKQGLRPDFLSAELCEQSPDLGRPQNENRGEIRPQAPAERLNSVERFENQILQPPLH